MEYGGLAGESRADWLLVVVMGESEHMKKTEKRGWGHLEAALPYLNKKTEISAMGVGGGGGGQSASALRSFIFGGPYFSAARVGLN